MEEFDEPVTPESFTCAASGCGPLESPNFGPEFSEIQIRKSEKGVEFIATRKLSSLIPGHDVDYNEDEKVLRIAPPGQTGLKLSFRTAPSNHFLSILKMLAEDTAPDEVLSQIPRKPTGGGGRLGAKSGYAPTNSLTPVGVQSGSKRGKQMCELGRRNPTAPASQKISPKPFQFSFPKPSSSPSPSLSKSSASPFSSPSSSSLPKPPMTEKRKPPINQENWTITNKRPATETTPSKLARIPLKQPLSGGSGGTQQSILQHLEGNTERKGFVNIGNSCYMNAVLQGLLGLQEFVRDLLSTGKRLRAQKGSVYECLMKIAHAKSEALGVVNVKQLKDVIASKYPRFGGNAQQDAQEFLNACLNYLHDDVIEFAKDAIARAEEGAQKTPEEQQKELANFANATSAVSQNFFCELEFEMTCLNASCKFTRKIKEQFFDFSLDLESRVTKGVRKPKPSLQDLLEAYFNPRDMEYKCSKCEGNRVSQVPRISKLPRVLILHIKRFTPNYATQTYEKTTEPISVNESLDLQFCVTENTLGPMASLPSSTLGPAPSSAGSRSVPVSPSSAPPRPVFSPSRPISPPRSRPKPPSDVWDFIDSPEKSPKKSLDLQSIQDEPTLTLWLKQEQSERHTSEEQVSMMMDYTRKLEELKTADVTELDDISNGTPSMWSCGACTFENAADATKCQICEAPCKPKKQVISELPSLPPYTPQEIEALCRNPPTRPSIAGDKLRYSLRCIVSHKGLTWSSGHYFADVLGDDKQWTHFDDQYVNLLPSERVLTAAEAQGYVFFLVHDR